MNQPLKALGNRVTEYTGLETFPAPPSLQEVTLVSDEVTAVCPVTGQPDWYTIKATYHPVGKCIESKTFKLFLHSLRMEGIFCEALSARILQEVVAATGCARAQVEVMQKPRGGVAITAVSAISHE